MSTFDRMEIIEEIEEAAQALGVEKLTVMSRLADLQDSDLLKLLDALKAIQEI